MTKRCPECGLTFTADEKFCDQDATALVPLAAPVSALRRALKWLIVAAVLVALAICGVIWGPAVSRQYLMAHLAVSFSDVQLENGTGLLPDPTLVLKVANTTGVSASLRSAHLTCKLSGSSVVTLDGPPPGSGPLKIPSSSGPTELRFHMEAHWPGLLDLVTAGKLPEGWEGTCKGPIGLTVWGINFSHEVEVQGGLK